MGFQLGAEEMNRVKFPRLWQDTGSVMATEFLPSGEIYFSLDANEKVMLSVT